MIRVDAPADASIGRMRCVGCESRRVVSARCEKSAAGCRNRVDASDGFSLNWGRINAPARFLRPAGVLIRRGLAPRHSREKPSCAANHASRAPVRRRTSCRFRMLPTGWPMPRRMMRPARRRRGRHASGRRRSRRVSPARVCPIRPCPCLHTISASTDMRSSPRFAPRIRPATSVPFCRSCPRNSRHMT